MEQLLITPKEAGKALNISENKVRELCENDPSFPATKNGAYFKVSTQLLQEWVAKKCRNREPI